MIHIYNQELFKFFSEEIHNEDVAYVICKIKIVNGFFHSNF